MLFLVLVADFFVLVLVFVNGIVIFSFLVIFVFVFVNENHTAYMWTLKQAVHVVTQYALRPLQVDNIFVFIRQVAPVPAMLAI